MDLRPLRTAEEQLIAIEESMVDRARSIYDQLRTRLLDLLMRNGRLSAAEIERVGQQVRAELEQLLSGQLQEVGGLAQEFAAAEIERLAELLGRSIAVPEPMLDDVVAAERDLALAFLAGLLASMVATAGLLELERATAEQQATRLLADDIANGDRASIWRLGLIGLTAGVAGSTWGTWNGGRQLIYRELGGQIGYQRQAIAAIDRRTTNCCLQVHGQIVAVDQPFKLNGTPRYGSEMLNPPFHYRCRTSVVLYHSAMEEVGTTTEQMRQQARQELARR